MTAQSEVQTEEKKFARQMLPGTFPAPPRRPPPPGRPFGRTCASRPGPSRLGADRRALPTYPFLISRPRWWGAVPAAALGSAAARVAMPKTWPGIISSKPMTWSSAAHRRSSWLDVASDLIPQSRRDVSGHTSPTIDQAKPGRPRTLPLTRSRPRLSPTKVPVR